MMKRIALSIGLFSLSAFALTPQTVKIGADGWNLWWTTECGALVCAFQRSIQPMTEEAADTLEGLDDSKIYTCSMKARTQGTAPTQDNERTRVWLAYEISNCVLSSK